MYVQGYLQGSENGRVVTIGDLEDENNKILTEWKGFETTILFSCSF